MNKRTGFSLVEMLVSLFIFVIVSSMLSIKIGDNFKKMQYNARIYSIRNILQKVRVRAILKYEIIKIIFKDNDILIMKKKKDKWIKFKKYDFSDLTFKSNNTPIFYPYGTVSKLFSLYIISKEGIKKITMNINGRINIY